MTTLTLTQQEALDFYSENVEQVKYFGLTHLADREERLLFRQGKKLINSMVDSVKNTRGTLEKYNNEERMFIAVSYNSGLTRKEIVTQFTGLFRTHTPGSIGQKVEMCKSVDNTHKTHTEFQFRDEELISMLQSLDSDRYQLN